MFRLCHLCLILSLMLVPTVQAREALWRAENEAAGDVVPPFTGGGTPFPKQDLRDDEPENDDVPQLSEEELAELERANRAAVLLERVRNIIEEGRIFVPDVSDVIVEGRLKGDEGMRVLIQREWKRIGGKIYVPVVGTNKAEAYIRELEELDPNLAQIVSEEINLRLEQSRDMELTIIDIKGDDVTLQDTRGELYTVSLKRSRW